MPSYLKLSSVAIQTPFFTLRIKQTRHTTHILMRLTTDIVTTRNLPLTYTLLEKRMPSVLQTQCFNDDNYTFAQEVKATEIGHLFEHILIDYLCLLKVQQGAEEATYRGVTNWNWYEDPKGTFYIHINAGSEDMQIFTEALEKTILLTHSILQAGEVIPQQQSLHLNK